MTTIDITASKRYRVHIGKGLLNNLSTAVEQLIGVEKVCIVSDTNVWPLYGSIVENRLHSGGFQVFSFVFPAGEESKNGYVYLKLLNFLAENQLTRTDCLVALGGGVVGDLTGFAAATYLRGIPYIQVPTTLLAAVDSSVGGKTAIDLDAGKNLAGAFYQPAAVLCDTDTLDTLPEEIFLDGCAEVIKYAVLFDHALFDTLVQSGPDFDRETVIARCVDWKNSVVTMDEFDRGQRQKLNLGHTVGHGVESQSHYTISHGKAVAIGMAIVTRACAKRKLCSENTMQKVLDILKQFRLPITTNFSADELYRTMLSDKKRSGDHINMILPAAIGNCIIHPIPTNEIKAFIEEGL